MKQEMAGLNVLITAGPTHEHIDPVRFITNASSGKMGHALARAAQEAGAKVTIISGPVNIVKSAGTVYISVVSALEMYEAVMHNIASCDIFLAVAAVGDYRCKTMATQKIHKHTAPLLLELVPNPDIVSSVADMPNKPFIVGFAAETENVLEQAEAKRKRKNMDLIIANRVGYGMGMGADENEVTVLSSTQTFRLPLMPKQQLAQKLVTIIATEYHMSRA